MITIDIQKPKSINNQYSGFVTFKYDPKIVAVMRSLPVKHYYVDSKQWEIPLNKVEWVMKQLQGYDIDLVGNLDALKKENEDVSVPKDFKFKTKPFEHQLKAFEYGLKHNCWFLGDEQGLGKSKQSIDIAVARKFKYGYKHCLIVCGVNTLKWNWVNEIETHSNEGSYILGQRTLKNGNIKIGSTNDKINDLTMLQEDKLNLPYFIITNVESFRCEPIAKTIQQLCNNEIINMCIADELHKMKNPTSQQTKGFLKCNCDCKIAMTGTPLMNNPLDLYVLLRWLGYEEHSYYAFRNHYCVLGGFGGYEIIGYKNMEQLTNAVQDIMLRRLKKDVFDLPEKIYVEDYVDMTPKQAIIYKEVETEIKSNIDMIKFDNNPLSTLIRLRQATGYTGILSSIVQESAKLDRMEDIVDEAISNNQKVVIFSNWTQMTDAIFERLNKPEYMPQLITGDTKDSERQGLVNNFQYNSACKVLVGTIGAMGTGLTLTAGTVIIFLDEPWNRALFDQAVDRCHRIGTTSNITIYSLMCKNTIDEKIHKLIYKKGRLSDAIIDGHIIGDKSAVLDYLLN